MSGPAKKKELRDRLVHAVEKARDVDVRTFEENMSVEGLTLLRSQVSNVMTACTAVAKELLALEEADQSSNAETAATTEADPFARDFALKLDALVEESSSESNLQDIAFIVHLELKSRLNDLSALVINIEDWSSLETCGAGLRAVRKAGATLERAICASIGLESTLDFETELQSSLAIRELYARFRRSVDTLSDTMESDLRVRMRRGGTEIAIIIGRDQYRDLRVNDRYQLRRFQEEILSWLRGESGFDEHVAERIWKDFSTFSELLALVNRREELMEHDRDLLIRLDESLRCATESPRIEANKLDEFALLRGLDDRIDSLFKSGVAYDLSLWKPIVADLLPRYREAEPATPQAPMDGDFL